MEDIQVLRSIQRVNRERIPQRVVHPKGITVYGVFQVTNADISRYTKAAIFNGVGKKTRAAVRFSLAFGEKGTADTSFLDLRGMAIKFYTEEGNSCSILK